MKTRTEITFALDHCPEVIGLFMTIRSCSNENPKYRKEKDGRRKIGIPGKANFFTHGETHQTKV